ncbi:MarR family winged helix-turn-helix transcriptional regulator [Solwaraspora sp. WMMB335]|uniref:MarR family winged helix-turn-helix transcriptional regulator n=1 Tax=Solwaraspora sp. WMMB335 TaxID=3404118 RepID=UPI003B926053
MERNSSNRGVSTLLFDVWLVSHLAGRLLDEALRPTGLTSDEFGLYSLIHTYGPGTPTQISRWTGMAPTTVSGMVRRITTRGHGTLLPNPDDARSRLLRLSDDGLQVTVAAAGVLAATLPRLQRAIDRPEAVRAGLSDLDAALRRVLDAAPRPYTVPPTGPSDRQPVVSYAGAHLTEAQTTEVRTFIDWIRARDSEATRTRPAANP